MRVGDLIPEFALPDQDWNNVSSGDLIGNPCVIYFYPKDDTPGCTKQACSFRDQFHIFQEHGAEVLGVSGDTPEQHRAFQGKYNLPFKLLSDKGAVMRKKFGVENHLLGLLPGRETFVFNQAGKLVLRFNSNISASKHITQAIEALSKIEAS